jgi:hypothetical protein
LLLGLASNEGLGLSARQCEKKVISQFEETICRVLSALLHVKHFANLRIVNNQHQLAVLAHGTLRHLYRISFRAGSTYDKRYSAKAAFKQILLGREYLALLDFARVVFELEQDVSAV